MQKKIIFSFIVLNVFVLTIIGIRLSYSNQINEQLQSLNDNQIRMYNPRGFTTTEMDAVSKLDNISDAVFDDRNIFPRYHLEANNFTLSIGGISVEENNQYQKELEYIAGSYLTDPYQVVITQSVADELINIRKLDSYDSLINTDLVDGLEIVGIYKDNSSVYKYLNFKDYEFDADTQSYITNPQETYENSFYIFNRGEEYDKDELIQRYNVEVMWDYQSSGDYNTVVDNMNDSDNTNDEGETTVNYEESVANGAKGLIDPNTDAYGDKFNQFAFIETNQDSKEQVVSKLQEMFPEAAVQTNQTTYSQLTNSMSNWLKLIIGIIILEIAVFVPMLRNSKK